MEYLSNLLSSEALNSEVVSGVSLAFALIFFVPLMVVAIAFWLYSAFTRTDPTRIAKLLSNLWLVACIPAGMLVAMGYAFNTNKLNPLIVMPFWIVLGLLPLWLPVAVWRLSGAAAPAASSSGREEAD